MSASGPEISAILGDMPRSWDRVRAEESRSHCGDRAARDPVHRAQAPHGRFHPRVGRDRSRHAVRKAARVPLAAGAAHPLGNPVRDGRRREVRDLPGGRHLRPRAGPQRFAPAAPIGTRALDPVRHRGPGQRRASGPGRPPGRRLEARRGRTFSPSGPAGKDRRGTAAWGGGGGARRRSGSAPRSCKAASAAAGPARSATAAARLDSRSAIRPRNPAGPPPIIGPVPTAFVEPPLPKTRGLRSPCPDRIASCTSG